MIRRREIRDCPAEALREAVVNALTHRNYMTRGNVTVRVCDDEVIVSSPGDLPDGVALEETQTRQHGSVARNPRLAQALYYAGLVERRGAGMTRIVAACLEQGLPAPEFEATPYQVAVTFRKER